jgi:hypothetical protein
MAKDTLAKLNASWQRESMADREGLYRDFHNIDLTHLKAMVRENRIR